MFTDDCIYFLSSKKKIEFLKQVENHKEENVPAIKLLVRDRVSVKRFHKCGHITIISQICLIAER